jgi:5'-nucleotidase
MSPPASPGGRPLALLSNDDGYSAAGLSALRTALHELMDVVVCAPRSEQSASSHALSLHRPLRLVEHEPGLFSVDGTPADCVYVAIHAPGRVLPRRPDLVVSGVNHGVNLGDDVFYSGTVAAAREGALKGVPSLAVSADAGADLAAVARHAAALVKLVARTEFRRPPLLNVNYPAGVPGIVRVTRLGARVYRDEVEFRIDPRGREYLWIGGPGCEHRFIAGSDTEAFDEGVVSITPLMLDLWAKDDQSELEMVVSDLPGMVKVSGS